MLIPTWLAKQRAVANLFSDLVNLYSMLIPYIEAMCCKNLGTAVLCRFENGASNRNQFQRVFSLFGLSFEGFYSYRPVISI